MKIKRLKSVLLSLKGLKARSNKTGFNIMVFILIFLENCLSYGGIHDFSV